MQGSRPSHQVFPEPSCRPGFLLVVPGQGPAGCWLTDKEWGVASGMWEPIPGLRGSIITGKNNLNPSLQFQ